MTQSPLLTVYDTIEIETRYLENVANFTIFKGKFYKMSLLFRYLIVITNLLIPNCHYQIVTFVNLPNCHHCHLTKLTLPKIRPSSRMPPPQSTKIITNSEKYCVNIVLVYLAFLSQFPPGIFLNWTRQFHSIWKFNKYDF